MVGWLRWVVRNINIELVNRLLIRIFINKLYLGYGYKEKNILIVKILDRFVWDVVYLMIKLYVKFDE